MRDFLHDTFLKSTDHMGKQYVRYIFVGGSAFIIDFALLVFFKEVVGLHYLVAATTSFLVGSVYNYALSTRFIFQTRVFSNKHLELLFFVLIGVSGLVLNSLIMYVCSTHVGVYASKILSGVAVFSWNFIVRRITLFSHHGGI